MKERMCKHMQSIVSGCGTYDEKGIKVGQWTDPHDKYSVYQYPLYSLQQLQSDIFRRIHERNKSWKMVN
ncbi:hypothetical protein FGO68_gene13771 [Halteria grandinella]|uniref:Uncharacterized protein n=1 Tax=Halteria grandinella TaxID=5974 RepID=A0A8J8NA45_HALGN|nr:hypothetical protein FGO68_gene13771 [Halteria grandinella]